MLANVGRLLAECAHFFEDVRLLFSETCHNVMREIVAFEAIRSCGKVESHVVFFVLVAAAITPSKLCFNHYMHLCLCVCCNAYR